MTTETRWVAIEGPRDIKIYQEGHARKSAGAIATVALRDGRHHIAREDAALIAAAPELLEAVNRLLNWDRQINGQRAEDVAFARSAAAKATVPDHA